MTKVLVCRHCLNNYSGPGYIKIKVTDDGKELMHSCDDCRIIYELTGKMPEWLDERQNNNKKNS
jgi:hypothetical protein